MRSPRTSSGLARRILNLAPVVPRQGNEPEQVGPVAGIAPGTSPDLVATPIVATPSRPVSRMRLSRGR